MDYGAEVLYNLKANEFEGSSILITGGAGFLGSWLVEVFLNLGANVTVLDNFITGNLRNIQHLLNLKSFKLIEGDICRFNIEHGRYDIIVHAASIPAPDLYVERPVDTLLVNSMGTYNVLEAARKYDALLLYTSTSEVYGDAEVVPTPETYWGKVNPIGPRSCYDEGKRFGEALCMAYHRQYGLDVRIARIFNTYGPRLDPDARYARVISQFITQALRNEPLTIYGDGRQTRSFCYVTDTVNALLRMLTCRRCRGEVINVGNPREITILELAKLIIRLTGSKSTLKFLPPRLEDPRRRCPDISRAKELLGWEPRVGLEDGLRHTIKWFRGLII